MRRTVFALAVCTAVLAGAPTLAEPLPGFPDLGGAPLCEASAAVITPCPQDPVESCLLVGDNEQRQSIFAIPFDGERLDPDRRTTIDFSSLLHKKDDFELSDLEAMTRLSTGEVLLYGSHGRNKECERKKKRRRYLGVRFKQGAPVAGEVGLRRTSEKLDLENTIQEDSTGALQKVRQAVREGEYAADIADKRRAGARNCDNAFNIEGAVALPDERGERIWIGLRGPLVDGKAVLLRQVAGLERLTFDRARLVDLAGYGIRDLTYARGWIWGLAGPLADSGVPFKLWRLRADELVRAGEAPLHIEMLADLPTSSEGLAIRGNTAVVVIDGKQGKTEDEPCAVDATYTTVTVPD